MSFSSREQPWSEAQWEAYLKEADLRAARFGELLETLQDHPDCEEIVSREMGWDKPVERDEEVTAFIEELNEALAEKDWEDAEDAPLTDPDEVEDEDVDEDEDQTSAVANASDDDDDDPFADDGEGVKAIPAYTLSMQVGEQVHEALRLYLSDDGEDDDADDRLSDAVINSLIPAAKIAKGHGLGYDDDVLCGNIVCCKTALQAATRSREALETLRQDGFLPPLLVNELVSRLRQVEQAIQERIESLRAKVWW